MFIGTSRKIMGQFAISGMLEIVGWIATAVMGAAAIGMIAALAFS
jgi:Mn2+/Fe2+ NRAMP family transporter